MRAAAAVAFSGEARGSRQGQFASEMWWRQTEQCPSASVALEASPSA